MRRLSAELIGQVQGLLARGEKQRAIARLLPISRGSVHAIARGRIGEQAETRPRPVSDAGDPFRPTRPHRCQCGALIVTTQCVACAAQQTPPAVVPFPRHSSPPPRAA
jgi:hypothetical protein